MKALVLALGLRMIGPAMSNPDAEPDQPEAQAGKRQIAVAPRRAVVHQHRGRQPIATKYTGERILHGHAALVGAGLEQHGEARMIIEHRQRMAACASDEREVSLEVHLPQLIGYAALEALPGSGSRRALRFNQTMAVQDLGDRARRQFGTTPIQQLARQFAPPQQSSDSARKLITSCSVVWSVRRG